MMNRASTVLSEHNRVLAARHYLALFNFLAILAGSVVTQYFMSVRGVPHNVMLIADLVIAVNAVQFCLCLADHIMKKFFGLYVKALVPVAYAVGVLWLALLALELTFSTLAGGILRIDLLIIVAVQIVTALIAYLVWSVLDRRALDAMMRSSVRDDDSLRAKKATSYVALYILLALAILVAQAGALFLYQIPPKLYDLFDSSRALGYELSSDARGYIVNEIYAGTSSYVNVPATYNNLPVIGIKSGALDEGDVRESEKVRTITFGSPVTDADGNTSTVSYLEFIDSGAIVNNQIETLTLPASLTRIGGSDVSAEASASNISATTRATNPPPAIVSSSLKTVIYQAQANFELFDFDCAELRTITMSGPSVGAITSVEGLSERTTIEVSKDIYNTYREDNIAYAHNFRPLIEENEFCVDFYTDCDVYIESIIASTEQTKSFDYLSGLTVDTEAYNNDPNELGTNGAKRESAFRGWYTDATFYNEYKIETGADLHFNKSMELYVKWVHEYTAELDWGNYTPDTDVEKIQHWTGERAERLPGYEGRLGYAAGVSWHVGDINGAVISDTETLHSDVTLVAEWLLDKPANIDIDPDKESDGGIYVSEDKNVVSFTYDEARKIKLIAAEGTHALKDNGVTLSHEWFKQGSSDSLGYTLLELKNVAESGVYTLRVTALATVGGETASAETTVSVTVKRKPLGLTENKIDMKSKTVSYGGTSQTITLDDPEGKLGTLGVLVSYEYRAEGSSQSLGADGVRNAGKYDVFATVRKASEADRANYEETTLNAKLEITPKQLTSPTWKGEGDGWEEDTVTYDGKEHTILLEISPGDICGGDSVHFTYEAGSNKGTNADTYTAKAVGLDNPNYTYDFGDGVEKEWTIAPKTVTVLHWEIDGQDATRSASVTYSGSVHRAAAVLEGAVSEDTVNFAYSLTSSEVCEATNAGSYISKITGVDNPNYTFNTGDDTATLNWTIEKKELSVAIDAVSLTYNGAEQGVTARITGFIGAEADEFRVTDFECTDKDLTRTGNAQGTAFVLYFRATNAGNYTAAVKAIGAGVTGVPANYKISSEVSRAFEIAKKQLSFRPQQEYTYNGADQELHLAVEGLIASDVQSADKSQFETTAENSTVESGVFCLVYNGKEAKSYSVSVTSFSNNNYKFDEYSGSIEIAKKTLTVDHWMIKDDAAAEAAKNLNSGASFTYNKTGYTVSAVLVGIVGGEEVNLQLTSANGTAVNSYTTKATLPVSYTNYTLAGSNTSVSWSITPFTLNLKWKVDGKDITPSASYVYKGSAYTLTAVYEGTPGGEQPELTYHSKEDAYSTNATSVGVYTAEVTGTEDNNYTIGTGSSVQWSITPAPVTVKFTSGSYTYNGQYQGPMFTVDGLCAGDYENISIRVSAAQGSSTKNIDFEHTGGQYSFTGSTYGFAVDADTYTVTVTSVLLGGSVSGNYAVQPSGASQTFTIAQKEVKLTGAWQYKNSKLSTLTYEGGTNLIYNKAAYTLTATISPDSLFTRLAAAKDSVELTYATGSDVTNTATNVGNYTARITGLSGTYAKNYKLPATGLELAWKISPKKVTFTWSSASFTYTGSQQSITASCATGADSDADGKIYTGDSLTLTYADNAKIAAGDYTAKVTGIGNSNYTFDASDATASRVWKIAKRPVILNWSTKSFVYNGQNQYPTAEFIYAGTTVTVTGYTYPAGGAKNVKSDYSITATAIDHTDNFTLDGAQNLTHTYSITQRTVVLSWVMQGTNNVVSSQSLTYTGNAFNVEAVATNLCAGDSLTFSYTGSTSFTDAGSHAISVSAISGGTNNKNYQLGSGTSITVNVAKQVVTATWNKESATIVYNAEGHNGYFTATLGGTQAGRAYTVPHTVQITGGDAVRNAGKYTFTVKIADSDAQNYTTEGASNLTRELTISKKPVTVTWESDGTTVSGGSKTYTYDGRQHSLVPKIGGTANGEEITTTAKAERTNVGQDTVKVTTLSGENSSNYTLDNVSNTECTLIIQKQAVNIVWSGNGTRVYDGSSHKPTVTVTGATDKKTLTSSVSGAALTNVGSTTYTVSLTGTDATNYDLGTTNITCTLTITAATATVTWGTTTFTYNRNGHSITPTVHDKTNNGTVDGGSYNFNGKTETDAGEYNYTLTLTTNNYVFEGGRDSQTVMMTIEPATVTVNVGQTQFEENGEAHSITLEFIASGLELASGTDYTFNGTPQTAAGTYNFTLTLTKNFVFEDGKTSRQITMTITPKAAAESIAYDLAPDFKRISL